MWKVINVLQFVVFFLFWQIAIDPFAQTFIEQVRNLAFFEFLTDWAFQWIERKKEQCANDDTCNSLIIDIGSS